MKTQKLYKVTFRCKNGRHISYRKTLFLTYQIGRTTVPKFGKIFCFETIKQAINFIETNTILSPSNIYEIFEGTGINPTKIKVACRHFDEIEKFWQLKKQHKSVRRYLSTFAVPKGTVLVDSFTPKKIVDVL